MKFLTFKKKNGEKYVAPTGQVIRDVSDSSDNTDYGVTFATPLINEEELEQFAKEKSEEYKEEIDQGFIENPVSATPEEIESAEKAMKEQEKIDEKFADQPSDDSPDTEDFWKDVTKEIVRIKEDEAITTDDKLILLYNIYEGYDGAIPKEIEMELINLMTVLDAKLESEKRKTQETEKEEKVRSRINKLKNKVDVYREKLGTKKESKSNDIKSNSISTNDDDIIDWDVGYARLLAEAELVG